MSKTTVRTRATGGADTSGVGAVRHAQRRPVRRTFKAAPLFWMLALAMFIVGVGVLPAAGDPVPSGATATIAITVSPADTLWSIAASHKLPGVSTSEMVRLIKEANSLSGGAVAAGDTLRVPAEAMPDTAYAQVSDVSATR